MSGKEAMPLNCRVIVMFGNPQQNACHPSIKGKEYNKLTSKTYALHVSGSVLAYLAKGFLLAGNVKDLRV